MRTRDLAFNTVAALVVAAAVLWFGGGLVCYKWKTEVGKAAMTLRIDDIVEPAERLWILYNVHKELSTNYIGALDPRSMPLVELIEVPNHDFALGPGRLIILRGLFDKFQIPTKAEGKP